MKIIVCGTRTFDDYALLCSKLDAITKGVKKVIVVSGGAAGADRLGERWAFERGHSYEVYHADWSQGKKAGPLRNSEMVESGARALVAFWDGKSPGTKDIIAKAEKAKLQVRVIRFKGK
jgi:hypothetical protein